MALVSIPIPSQEPSYLLVMPVGCLVRTHRPGRITLADLREFPTLCVCVGVWKGCQSLLLPSSHHMGSYLLP